MSNRKEELHPAFYLVPAIIVSLLVAILPAVELGIHHAWDTTGGALLGVMTLVFGVVGFFTALFNLMEV